MKSAQHLLNEIITEILSDLTEGGAFREGQGEGGEGAMLQATFVGHTANNKQQQRPSNPFNTHHKLFLFGFYFQQLCFIFFFV